MPSLVHRFGAAGFLLGLAVVAASACGGAASSGLEEPPGGGDGGGNAPEGGGGTKGGADDASAVPPSTPDATTLDADGTDPIDASMGPGNGDDGDIVVDASADAGPLCGACPFGDRCCTTPSALSYGQCYSPICLVCCSP
jgi:hypothetical protein